MRNNVAKSYSTWSCLVSTFSRTQLAKLKSRDKEKVLNVRKFENNLVRSIFLSIIYCFVIYPWGCDSYRSERLWLVAKPTSISARPRRLLAGLEQLLVTFPTERIELKISRLKETTYREYERVVHKPLRHRIIS